MTLTNIATKGDDAVAGSNPSRFSANGSIEPVGDPKATIAVKARPTVSARGPVGSVIVEAGLLPKYDASDANGPWMAPSASPVGSSREAIHRQSRNEISRSARARMMNEVAYDPELPPELMMSGMIKVSTIALSSSVW
jgi:hypothetical protein